MKSEVNYSLSCKLMSLFSTVTGASGFFTITELVEGRYKNAMIVGSIALGSLAALFYTQDNLSKKINKLEAKVKNYEIKSE